MTNNRNNQPQAARQTARGFTLIELLAVVVIIMLLVSILVPSVISARKIVKVNQTKMTINMLDGACRMYATDMTPPGSTPVYPPSTPGSMGTPAQAMQGRHLLVECLVGYLNTNYDGVDGPGFRVPIAPGSPIYGKVTHGPYNGAEAAKTILDNNLPVFVDSFGNQILYYAYKTNIAPNVNGYDENDNTTAADGTVLVPMSLVPKQPNYACHPPPVPPAVPGDPWPDPPVYYQNSFLLISAGPDNVIADPLYAPSSDDVTNFR